MPEYMTPYGFIINEVMPVTGTGAEVMTPFSLLINETAGAGSVTPAVPLVIATISRPVFGF